MTVGEDEPMDYDDDFGDKNDWMNVEEPMDYDDDFGDKDNWMNVDESMDYDDDFDDEDWSDEDDLWSEY